ncbi:MAG: hypothetical protein ABFQ53_03735 [Patescibacteria group bacterium]
MQKSEIQQFEKLVNESSHVLVLLPENPHGDHFCSALAVAHFCDFKSIKTTIAFSDPYEQISLFDFLPQPQSTQMKDSISGTRDLILTFNTNYNKILDIKTDQTSDEFKIYVTPEKGMIDSRDFSFVSGKFPYDIIITIGATTKESMGRIFDEIPDIFYELPIINIDNKSANEQFGQVNIINNIASSTSEVLADIFEGLGKNQLSKPCSQCLLTGIIHETNSFQNNKTTPKAMTLASALLKNGADQQTIIKNLYRNLPFSLLQLWGRAMKNLIMSEYNQKTVITSLTYRDITQTGAKKHHLYSILKKLQENYPSGQIFVLLFEDKDETFSALINLDKANVSLEDAEIENLTTLPNNIYKINLPDATQENFKEKTCSTLAPYIQNVE